jgi:serine/threonine-protein kinase
VAQRTDDDLVRITVVLPEYIVERELGRGGMGVVFTGRHRRLDRPVAIKELPPAIAMDDEVRERFATEARTLASLAHPHIVPIFDYVEREGLCLIVMEQLPGGTLWDKFVTTGVTSPSACAFVMASCAALQHAHDRRVLHLDVKPDNLMFDADGLLKVTDFGISSVIGGGRTLGTVDGTVLGTPAYMAPEQARGDELIPATDTYAAGVMLYEMLSGQLPWLGAETAADLLRQRLDEDPIVLSDVAPRVPQPIVEVVMHSLRREADERYTSAEDFGAALGEACAAGWGSDWLDHAGVAIQGSQRLAIAARTGPAEGEGEHGFAAGAGGAAPSLSVMRAGGGRRLAGLDLNRLNEGDLVDVEDLLHPPPPPRRAIIVTAILAVLALIAAVVGLGGLSHDVNVPRGAVFVAGDDIASGDRVEADLSHDVLVTIRNRSLADRSDEVVLRLSTIGIPLGTASAAAINGRAVIDPGTMRLLAAGKVEGEIELRNKGSEIVTSDFPFRSTSPWYLTAMGIGSLLVLLIAAANLESSLKPLSRGRSRSISVIGGVVWGAVIACSVVALSAALSIAEMTIVSLLVSGLFGAAAGVSSCYVAAGMGRRRKLRRALKRAERRHSRETQGVTV